MKRTLSAAVALLIGWACFGFTAYWLLAEIQLSCTRWMDRSLNAECFAPAGQVLAVVTFLFIASSGTLAFLAMRKR